MIPPTALLQYHKNKAESQSKHK